MFNFIKSFIMKFFREVVYNCPLTFREAIELKDYIYLRKCLINKPSIYSRDADGFTPLQIALQVDDIEMVKFLLDNEMDPNQCYLRGNWKGCSSLHFALCHRSSFMAMLMIDYGADIFFMSPDKMPPIYIAIKYNRVRVIHHVMDNGISPDSLINDELSLLTYAVIKGNISIIKCILKHKPNVNFHQNQQALVAAIHGNVNQSKRLVNMLYDYGFTLQPIDINLGLIQAAVTNGHYKAVVNLLELGVEPDKIISYPKEARTGAMLHIAVEAEELEIVQLLLKHGVNVHLRDSYGYTAILLAAYKKNMYIIRLLLKHGADAMDRIDDLNYTALHCTMLEYPENLNWTLNQTITKIFELFISKGVDINAKTNNSNSTALHFAVDIGLSGVVRVLLAHGAHVNEFDVDDFTPLSLGWHKIGFMIFTIIHDEDWRTAYELKFCTLELLQHHVYRIHQIGLPVCEKNIGEIENESKIVLINNVRKHIDNEIKFIKETKLSDSSVTLQRFLTSTDEQSAGFVRNELLLKNLKELLYRPRQFSECARLIRHKLSVALKKKELTRVTFQLLNSFFEEKKLPFLPDECIEHIISFLSDKDKEIVINQFVK